MQTSQSSALVLSRRHSKVSSDGGVRLSVPANSKIVELEPVSGARSRVVSGGTLSFWSRTSHS